MRKRLDIVFALWTTLLFPVCTPVVLQKASPDRTPERKQVIPHAIQFPRCGLRFQRTNVNVHRVRWVFVY